MNLRCQCNSCGHVMFWHPDDEPTGPVICRKCSSEDLIDQGTA